MISQRLFFRARDRNRTGTVLLQQDFKSCASASSATRALYKQQKTFRSFTKMGGEGFEPSKALPADLQSVPFGHSGIHPYQISNIKFEKPMIGLEPITC